MSAITTIPNAGPKLLQLDLSDNRISRLSPGMFDELAASLQYLMLSRNTIADVATVGHRVLVGHVAVN